ncbi:MAG TPA: cupin domain-containing protein [Verrucomicrobiae bacterium]|nr:cupin domain-containing protein [Verrucomicrobiae bacterium]
MVLYDWSQVPAEEMNAHVTRRCIHTDAMTIARLHIKKGGVVPEHKHVHEQVAHVESGALRFTVAGVEQVVRSGQSLVLPSMVPHGVEALEDTDVLDTFTPVRQDWLSGDDSYLRR